MNSISYIKVSTQESLNSISNIFAVSDYTLDSDSWIIPAGYIGAGVPVLTDVDYVYNKAVLMINSKSVNKPTVSGSTKSTTKPVLKSDSISLGKPVLSVDGKSTTKPVIRSNFKR